MNVLHLRASNFYGGPERQLHYHALRARYSEFGLTVGSFSEKGREPEFLGILRKDGVATTLIGVRSPYDPEAIGRLREYLRKSEVKILCTHDYRTHTIGFLAKRGTGSKWVAFSRGWTAENLKVRIYHLIERIIVRYADHIVAVSKTQKKKLSAWLIREDGISVVHNAVEPKMLSDAPVVDLRSRFGFPDGAVICISAGRFSREKGQAELARAAHLALQENDRLRFLLFGDGHDLEDVRREIARLGRQDRILCPGFEENLIGCLRDADIAINPSLSEGLPNVVLEAMALRRPVIATAVGGVPELITDGENGILVPAGDELAAARAILELAADHNRREKLGNSAYETVADGFSFEAQMGKLAEIYRLVGSAGTEAVS
jgi:glycosyltransferase involved in cell wall biosynthesis